MQVSEIIHTVQSAGGELWVAGESLGYSLPESAASVVDELRENKRDLLELLRQRPVMPPEVRVVRWDPLSAPVKVNRWLTVLDTDRFIRNKVSQLAARLSGDSLRAGNWSLSELLEFLDIVGVTLALSNDSRRLH